MHCCSYNRTGKMKEIEIKGFELKTFLRYLGEHLHTQPNGGSEIHKFVALIDYENGKSRCIIAPNGPGSFWWHHNGEMLLVFVKEEGKPQPMTTCIDYFVRITVAHDDFEVASRFVKHAVTFTAPAKECQIQIHYSRSKGFWEHFSNIYAQPIERVYLDKSTKSAVLDKIDKFVASKQRYIDFGRPYKLNFLLTGVPGAGKTSLVKAIALKYNKPIYVINFSKQLTDETLVNLMAEVNDDAIVLMEDIDAFFVDRESKDNHVSFSALLNILDGTMVKGNGSMIFLTANNPERLDPALVRQGRIDHMVKFDYPRQSEIREAFNDLTGGADEAGYRQFCDMIKGIKVSMSSVIDFFFRHPNDFCEHFDEFRQQLELRNDINDSEKCAKLYM